MLVAAAQLIMHAAYSLGAKDITTEETNTWVAEFLLRTGAAAPVCLFDQAVEVFRQANQFEDGRVWKTGPQTVILKANARARCIPVKDPSGNDGIEGTAACPCRVNGDQDLIKGR